MKNDRLGLYVRLSKEEKDMIDLLKSKYSMNISQMIKNHLHDTFGRLENVDNRKK